jgi:UrcA family protein
MKPLAKTLTHALAALGLAGAAISPALAGDIQKTTIRVSTTDIDLGTAKGQKTLDKRVEKAVRQVCRTTSLTTGSRMMSRDALACLAKARTDAKRQVAARTLEQQRGG